MRNPHDFIVLKTLCLVVIPPLFHLSSVVRSCDVWSWSVALFVLGHCMLTPAHVLTPLNACWNDGLHSAKTWLKSRRGLSNAVQVSPSLTLLVPPMVRTRGMRGACVGVCVSHGGRCCRRHPQKLWHCDIFDQYQRWSALVWFGGRGKCPLMAMVRTNRHTSL